VLVLPLGPVGAFALALGGALAAQALARAFVRARERRSAQGAGGVAVGALAPRARATGSARADR
jgi:hypothetical protein